MASSTNGGKNYAICDTGFEVGLGSWAFTITKDEAKNEMVAFGMATKPIISPDYEISSSMFMYKPYNGTILKLIILNDVKLFLTFRMHIFPYRIYLQTGLKYW